MWNQIWAEGVLLIRTYAFWGNRLPLLVAMTACLAGVAGWQIYVAADGMTRE